MCFRIVPQGTPYSIPVRHTVPSWYPVSAGQLPCEAPSPVPPLRPSGWVQDLPDVLTVWYGLLNFKTCSVPGTTTKQMQLRLVPRLADLRHYVWNLNNKLRILIFFLTYLIILVTIIVKVIIKIHVCLK